MKNANANSERPSLEAMKDNVARAEAMLKSLANAKRLMILCHLTKSEKTVGQLAELVELSQSALSQHLAKMRESGLLTADKRGQMVFYSIADPDAEAILLTLYRIYCA